MRKVIHSNSKCACDSDMSFDEGLCKMNPLKYRNGKCVNCSSPMYIKISDIISIRNERLANVIQSMQMLNKMINNRKK